MVEKNHMWINPELAEDLFLAPIYNLDTPEKGGNQDRRISLEEIKNTPIPNQPNFTVKNEDDFIEFRNAVETYETLCLNYPRMTSAQRRWQAAWQTEKIISDCENNISQSYIQLKPTYSNNIEVSLLDMNSLTIHATVKFEKNTESSALKFTDGKEYDFFDLPYEWMTIIVAMVPDINEDLGKEDYILENRRNLRKTLFACDELIRSNYYAGLYTKPDGVFSGSEIIDELEQAFLVNFSNSIMQSGHDQVMMTYEHNRDFMSCHCLFEVRSSERINDSEIEDLQDIFSVLPSDMQDFFSYIAKTKGQRPFNIVLLPNQEFKSINPNAGGMYISPTNALYINKDALGLLESKTCLVHELCHAIFDMMVPNLWASTFFTALSIPMWFSYELKRAFPEDGSESLNNVVALGFGGYIGIQAYIAASSLSNLSKVSIFKKLLAGSAFYMGDQAIHFLPYSEGLMATQYEQIQNMIDSGVEPIDASVSFYATRSKSELAAESLSAFAFTEDDILENGFYVNWTNIGMRSREELMEKHPALYLAYETFFSKDSPMRFDSSIFTDEKAQYIFVALSRHWTDNLTMDLIAAKQDLWTSFSQ